MKTMIYEIFIIMASISQSLYIFHVFFFDCVYSPICFSALSKIIVTGYKVLQLSYFFTVGADEVKAWTIQVA